MKWSSWYSLLIYCGALTDAPLLALSLHEALQQTRQSALELRADQYELEKLKADAQKIDSPFDTKLYSTIQSQHDESEAQSAFAGKSRKNQSYALGVTRLFSTGTQADLKISHQKNETTFESSASQNTTDPTTTQAVPTFSGNSTLTYNPAYSTRYELTLSQQLLRNFNTSEIKAQKRIAEQLQEIPKHHLRAKEQSMQAEAERIYWRAAFLKEQIRLSQQLVKKTKEFVAQMRRRVRLGRADSVDEAEAEANQVTQEGEVLKLEIQLKQSMKQLAYRLTDKERLTIATLDTSIKHQPLKLPSLDPTEAFQFAQEHRQDLQLYDAQFATINTKKSLANEIGKPQLAVFGSVAQSGLDKTSGDSFEKANTHDYPTYTIGLRFEMPLGRTESAASKLSAIAEQAKLGAQRQQTLHQLKRNLDVALSELNGADQLIALAEKKIRTFETKRKRETIKLRQARTDQVSVIRYELEILGAQKELIAAYKRKRDAEANLRLLMHAYPSELN